MKQIICLVVAICLSLALTNYIYLWAFNDWVALGLSVPTGLVLGWSALAIADEL
jgi:hypothetical protein